MHACVCACVRVTCDWGFVCECDSHMLPTTHRPFRHRSMTSAVCGCSCFLPAKHLTMNHITHSNMTTHVALVLHSTEMVNSWSRDGNHEFTTCEWNALLSPALKTMTSAIFNHKRWTQVAWTQLMFTTRDHERKGKEEYLYSAFLHQGTYKALRHGSHSFTCKQHHSCLSFVAFTRCHHHSNWGSRHPIAAH